MTIGPLSQADASIPATAPWPGQKWVVLDDTGSTEIGTIVEATEDGFKVQIGDKLKILKREDLQNIASADEISSLSHKVTQYARTKREWLDATYVGGHYMVEGQKVKIIGVKQTGPLWSLIYENPDGSKGEVDVPDPSKPSSQLVAAEDGERESAYLRTQRKLFTV